MGHRQKGQTEMNQLEKIINYIDEHGSITQREALNFCGCGRLASRICDLKQADYKIKTELIKVKNADGSTSRVACYSWEGAES